MFQHVRETAITYTQNLALPEHGSTLTTILILLKGFVCTEGFGKLPISIISLDFYLASIYKPVVHLSLDPMG